MQAKVTMRFTYLSRRALPPESEDRTLGVAWGLAFTPPGVTDDRYQMHDA